MLMPRTRPCSACLPQLSQTLQPESPPELCSPAHTYMHTHLTPDCQGWRQVYEIQRLRTRVGVSALPPICSVPLSKWLSLSEPLYLPPPVWSKYQSSAHNEGNCMSQPLPCLSNTPSPVLLLPDSPCVFFWPQCVAYRILVP